MKLSRRDKDLTYAQEKAAVGLSEGLSQAEVARRLGFSEQSLSRWMKKPKFRDRVNTLSRDATKDVLTALKANLQENMEIIQDIARVGGEMGVVPSRLKAAMYLVDKVLRPVEKAGIQVDAEKRAREIVMEVEKLSGEEVDDLLFRGVEETSLIPELNDPS